MSDRIRRSSVGPTRMSAAEASRAALAQLRRAGLPPTPPNYAVCFAGQAGQDPALREALEGLGGRRALDQATLDRLHRQYLAPPAVADATLGQLWETVREAIAAIAGAGADAQRFGGTLRDAAAALAADPALVHAVVAKLIEETRRVAARNHALGARLSAAAARIAELEEQVAVARREALTDPLSGLANRRGFDAALLQALPAAQAGGAPLAAIVLDIDHFKQVNDRRGHPIGDAVLRLLGRCLREEVRTGDCAARIGGEEFAALLPGSSDVDAAALANRVRQAFGGRRFRIRATGQVLPVLTLSAGVAARVPGEEAEALLQRADAALYAAKRGGRNRVVTAALPGSMPGVLPGMAPVAAPEVLAGA